MLPAGPRVWKGANGPPRRSDPGPIPGQASVASRRWKAGCAGRATRISRSTASATPSMARQAEPDRLTIYKKRPEIERYEALLRDTAPPNDPGARHLRRRQHRPDRPARAAHQAGRVGDQGRAPPGARRLHRDSSGSTTIVSVYYGVNQADTARLAEIVRDEFAGVPLDLVVDDASHLFDETRASFNALFPHLRPGGSYIIEDWSWPHRWFVFPNPSYRAVTPVSAFALELALVAACDDQRDRRRHVAARTGDRSPRTGRARQRDVRPVVVSRRGRRARWSRRSRSTRTPS